MGSRGQHPGREENNFARASSTSVVQAAQRVSRCQHCQCPEGSEEGDESPATIHSSVSSRDAHGNSSQGPTVANRVQCVGRCRCGREGEFGTGPHRRKLWCHLCRIHRTGEETVGCRRGVIAAVQHRDECIKTLAEGERRLETGGEEFCCTCPRRRGRVGRARGNAPRIGERSPEARSRGFVCPVEDMPRLSSRVVSWMEDRQGDVQEALIQRESVRGFVAADGPTLCRVLKW